MGNYSDTNGEYKNGFLLNRVTDLILDINGGRFKVVPTEITDGSGTEHTVLTLEMIM
jgi:hypothetical protein